MSEPRQRTLPYKPRIGRERRREVILEAAERVFSERGFDAPSLAELAAACDITKPTLAEHFSTKRDLYLAVLDRQGRRLVDYMAARVAEQKGRSRDRLRTVLDAFFGWVEEDPTAWRMLFRELPPDAAAAQGARQVREQATANVLASIRNVEPRLRELPETKQRMLAEFFAGGQEWLARWWYERPGVDRADVVELATDVIWSALRAAAKDADVGARPTRRRR